MVVDLNGNGDFTSIQEAINSTKAFPDEDITIEVRNGTYNEKVIIYSWNNRLTIRGESRDSTIITWGDYFGKIDKGRNSTFHTYTMKVESNDVFLENLSITNSAGPVGQAIALHLEGDRIKVKNCNIDGHQDTFYAAGEGFRSYLLGCQISGSTDFIFGEATVVFDDCEIVSKSNSYITAASTPENVEYGFVFLNCQLLAEDGINAVYLGRPWRSFASTIFIHCRMESHIKAAGWHNWGDEEKERTVRYAEYGSSGPGANDQKRVEWASVASKENAEALTPSKVYGNWDPKEGD